MTSISEQIKRSDNLAFVRKEKQKAAQAALQLLAGFERGTAVIPVPKEGGVAFPVKGGKVRYRALAGDVYDAEIAGAATKDGLVDIDVIIPGCEARFRLTGVRWSRG